MKKVRTRPTRRPALPNDSTGTLRPVDPITLALIVGLGGGVVGGTVSQLIAGWFKTHGDTRQIDAAAVVAEAAEIRWQREQEFERKKLSFDRLRDVSVRLVQAHADQSAQYLSLHWDDGQFDAKELRTAQSARYAAEVELGLMVPSARPAIDEAKKALGKLDETEDGPMSGTEWWKHYDAYEKLRARLEDVMREVLAVDTVTPQARPQIEA